jgi:hypothetical protein
MRLGDSVRVEVRITRRATEGFSTDFQGPGPVRIEELPVGTTMKAELYGEDFKLTPISPPSQMLRAKGFRNWLWDIRPTNSGTLSIWLRVSVLYENQLLDSEVFERKIKVDVNRPYVAKSWMARNWDKVVAASGLTIATVLGGIIALIRMRTSDKTGARTPYSSRTSASERVHKTTGRDPRKRSSNHRRRGW